MIKHVKGDLLALADMGYFDVIAHGCNCHHMMGAGIAKQIAIKHPNAYDVDKMTTYGDPLKLGTFSLALSDDEELVIANLYTQFRGGICAKEILYPSIRSCFKELDKFFNNVKIGIPMIGSGIAGGDWEDILSVIRHETHNNDITIVEWDNQ